MALHVPLEKSLTFQIEGKFKFADMVLLKNYRYITTLAEFHQIGLGATHLEFKNTCTIATHAQLQSKLFCSDYNVCTLILQVHIIFQSNFDSICQKQIKKICPPKSLMYITM